MRNRGYSETNEILSFYINKHRDELMGLDNQQRRKQKTLQSIKDLYYRRLDIGAENRSFEEFLREEYVQTYDKDLNFIGYTNERQ